MKQPSFFISIIRGWTVLYIELVYIRFIQFIKTFKKMKDTLLYPPQKKNRKVPPYFPIRNSQKSTLINLLT